MWSFSRKNGFVIYWKKNMVTDHDTTKIIAICNETWNLIAFIIVVSKMGTWSVIAHSQSPSLK